MYHESSPRIIKVFEMVGSMSSTNPKIAHIKRLFHEQFTVCDVDNAVNEAPHITEAASEGAYRLGYFVGPRVGFRK